MMNEHVNRRNVLAVGVALAASTLSAKHVLNPVLNALKPARH